ncbi:MAG: hypothetical protein GX442_24280 [Candidatus Riflebacteria bacterium]|nr:hypothetical protein [Candidatus Riflebacteria bacterium]
MRQLALVLFVVGFAVAASGALSAGEGSTASSTLTPSAPPRAEDPAPGRGPAASSTLAPATPGLAGPASPTVPEARRPASPTAGEVSPEAAFQALRQRDYRTARPALLAAAAQGNARARLLAGLLLGYGEGGRRDLALAADLLERAARGGADVREGLPDGRHPLEWAAREGNRPLAELLLAKAGPGRFPAVDQPGKWGRTPLFVAVDAFQREMAAFLLSRGADPMRGDQDGRTPLHSLALDAWDDRSTRLAEMLLARGAKVDARMKDGSTPLHLATDRREVAAMKFLLGKGADVNALTENDASPLSLLLGRGLDGDTRTALKVLLDAGAEVKIRFPFGSGCLHELARHADCPEAVDLLPLLLARGADPNATDGNGDTPLIKALEGRPEDSSALAFVQALLAAGADPVRPGGQGVTPVMAALDTRNPERTKALLGLLASAGAALAAPDAEGRTPLHLLATEVDEPGTDALIGYFLARGTDPNRRDAQGRTALHLLAERAVAGTDRLARLLIDGGADPDAVDANRRTPLHIAVNEQDVPLIRLLLEKRARLDLTDRYGATPRDTTTRQDIIDLLTAANPVLAIPPATHLPLDPPAQASRAIELFQFLDRISEKEVPIRKQAFQLVVEQCPATPQAPLALWHLANLYRYGQSTPDWTKVADLLETLLARYPRAIRVDPDTKVKEALDPPRKLLALAYLNLGRYGPMIEIFAPLFETPDNLSDFEYGGFGLDYGEALEKTGRRSEARRIYEGILEREGAAADTQFARAARERLARP